MLQVNQLGGKTDRRLESYFHAKKKVHVTIFTVIVAQSYTLNLGLA